MPVAIIFGYRRGFGTVQPAQMEFLAGKLADLIRSLPKPGTWVRFPSPAPELIVDAVGFTGFQSTVSAAFHTISKVIVIWFEGFV